MFVGLGLTRNIRGWFAVRHLRAVVLQQGSDLLCSLLGVGRAVLGAAVLRHHPEPALRILLDLMRAVVLRRRFLLGRLRSLFGSLFGRRCSFIGLIGLLGLRL